MIKKLLKTLPFLKKFYKELNQYRNQLYVTPGHYYSPINRLGDHNNKKEKNIQEVILEKSKQKMLFENFKKYYNEFPYFSKKNNEKYLFNLDNDFFTYSDAIFLFSMIKEFKPKKIIEVGSGYSSALMIDTNIHFFDNNLDLAFIEPYPEERFLKLVRENSKYSLFKQNLQEIPVSRFHELGQNDILFIDSSHVAKHNSDVLYLLFEILPKLKKGVIIHFHDIFYPFDYPKDWLIRSWNEAYILRAFLMYNTSYEIMLWGSYIIPEYKDWFEDNMPMCLKNHGGSIWIKKVN